MREYELSQDAQQDLLEIARYTLRTWGSEQARYYELALTRCFESIASGEARARTPLTWRPELRVCRCEHHFVFWLQEGESSPLILAVWHESMDLMVRLRARWVDSDRDQQTPPD